MTQRGNTPPDAVAVRCQSDGVEMDQVVPISLRSLRDQPRCVRLLQPGGGIAAPGQQSTSGGGDAPEIARRAANGQEMELVAESRQGTAAIIEPCLYVPVDRAKPRLLNEGDEINRVVPGNAIQQVVRAQQETRLGWVRHHVRDPEKSHSAP